MKSWGLYCLFLSTCNPPLKKCVSVQSHTFFMRASEYRAGAVDTNWFPDKKCKTSRYYVSGNTCAMSLLNIERTGSERAAGKNEKIWQSFERKILLFCSYLDCSANSGSLPHRGRRRIYFWRLKTFSATF